VFKLFEEVVMIGENTVLSQRQTYEELFEQGKKVSLDSLTAGSRFLCKPRVVWYGKESDRPYGDTVRSWVVDEKQMGGVNVDSTDEDNGEIWRLSKDSLVVRLEAS
jgi:hypothetical protein